MVVADKRKGSSADNLAKARQAKLEKQQKKKELEKYIIWDSDDEDFDEEVVKIVPDNPEVEEVNVDTEEDEKPKPKKEKKTVTKASKPTRAAVTRAAKKELAKQKRAEELMKEIAELKNDFKKFREKPVIVPEPEKQAPEPERKPIESQPQVQPAPVVSAISRSEISRNKIINF